MSQRTDDLRARSASDNLEEARWQLSRRTFCRLAASAAAILSTGALAAACVPESKPTKKPPPLPTCKAAKTDDEKTIEAFCEVVIPGLQHDPLKKPGAVEACAVQLFFDPELPAAALIPLIVLMLNSSAKAIGKKPFVELSYEQQIQAVARSEDTLPEFAFAIQLVRLAYYSSEVAAYTMGYPGANNGYVDDPNFSFKKPMSKEKTQDGNMP